MRGELLKTWNYMRMLSFKRNTTFRSCLIVDSTSDKGKLRQKRRSMSPFIITFTLSDPDPYMEYHPWLQNKLRKTT